jgi:hypothetical protein
MDSTEDLQRDVLYCCTCKEKAYLLPGNAVHPMEKAMRILGTNQKSDEELGSILDTLLKIMKNTQTSVDHWPQVTIPEISENGTYYLKAMAESRLSSIKCYKRKICLQSWWD